MAYRQRRQRSQGSQGNRRSPRSRGSSCSQGSPLTYNHQLAFYKVFHKGHGKGYTLKVGSHTNEYEDPQLQFDIELPPLDDEEKAQPVACEVHEIMVDNVVFPWKDLVHVSNAYCIGKNKRTGQLEYKWMRTALFVRQQILKEILAKS